MHQKNLLYVCMRVGQLQRHPRAHLEGFFGASYCRNMPLGLPRQGAGVGGVKTSQKSNFGHALAVLSALAPKVKRPRFKLPQLPESPVKSAGNYRGALARQRAPRLRPKAGARHFGKIGPAPGEGQNFIDPERARGHRDIHRRPKSRGISSIILF